MSSNKKTRPARRRSSFKLRITVWITLLIAVVSSLGIGGILITGSQIADSRLQNELISTVERNAFSKSRTILLSSSTRSTAMSLTRAADISTASPPPR